MFGLIWVWQGGGLASLIGQDITLCLYDWSQKDIADQLGINKSSVNYHVKKLKDEGLID